MADAGQRARARDVAELAGVSVATVSRVVNGKDHDITEPTRRRVLDAARQLQYRPNPTAVSLRRGSTRTLGLIVPDIGDQYFQQIAKGAETAARDRGYGIVFCNTERDPDRETRSLEFLIDKDVDGIVLCGGGLQDEAHLSRVDLRTRGVVAIGPHQVDVPTLRVDDRGAMAAVVRHLAGLGRHRMLCIAGRRDWLITRVRLAAVTEAAAACGMTMVADGVFYSGFTATSGAEAMSEALDRRLDFDCAVVFNDYAAVGAMDVLLRHGCAVPEQVAVVGCDDTEISAFAMVPLTTIRFPTNRLGRTAVEVLCDGAPVPDETFGFDLITRASSTGRD